MPDISLDYIKSLIESARRTLTLAEDDLKRLGAEQLYRDTRTINLLLDELLRRWDEYVRSESL
jgi:hypothetical protein